MSSKNRIEYIDAMRGFTMILVVYAHVVFFSFGIDSSYPSFNQFFMLMRMPLFFFISGFIFYRETTWTSKIVSQFICPPSPYGHSPYISSGTPHKATGHGRGRSSTMQFKHSLLSDSRLLLYL